MRNLTVTFSLAIVLHLVVGVGGANALPKCTNWSYRHNCVDTYTWGNGSKYVGAWKDNLRHGQGTHTYGEGRSKGDKYVGEWKEHKQHGQGTYTGSNGLKHVGEWKAGKPNGQGTRTFGEGKWKGDKYVGEWKEHKQHGQGIQTFSDGDKYVGEWKDGKFHGQGTLTYADGDIKEGIWENGEFLYAKRAPLTREIRIENAEVREDKVVLFAEDMNKYGSHWRLVITKIGNTVKLNPVMLGCNDCISVFQPTFPAEFRCPVTNLDINNRYIVWCNAYDFSPRRIKGNLKKSSPIR